MAGGGLDVVMAQLDPALGQQPSTPARDNLLAALNGVVGDHLATSANPLAIATRLHHAGAALELEKYALAAAIPAPTGRAAVLVYGAFRNNWKGADGARPWRSISPRPRYTPVYMSYNSGLNISTNGRTLPKCSRFLWSNGPRRWRISLLSATAWAGSLSMKTGRAAIVSSWPVIGGEACRSHGPSSVMRLPRRSPTKRGDLGDRVVGDGLVPPSSALGYH